MKLDIVAVRGQSTWWMWVIRDNGAVVEESATQFRSATAAEQQGREKVAELERRPARRPGW